MGTTNLELQEMAKTLKIKNFRGVLMRDQFKDLNPPLDDECGIYNLNDSSQNGSHWTAFSKRGDYWYHFCSYGSGPCQELIEYSNNKPILTHTYKIQGWNDTICGEFCILFLHWFSQWSKEENSNVAYARAVLLLNDLSNA